MRLVTFTLTGARRGAAHRLGVELADGRGIVDLAAFHARGELAPGSAAPRFLEWFDLDGPWLPAARALLPSFDATADRERRRCDGVLVPAESVSLAAPVPRPGKIVCVGLNYRDHAAEARMPVPDTPVIFAKFPTAVIGPGAPILLPPAAPHRVDFEAELAVVVGRRARHVTRRAAMRHVLGFTNANDVSARDIQKHDGQWVRAKSCDTFAPLGPAVVTLDEVADPHALPIRLRLNGTVLQDSNTDQLVFDIPALLEFLSATMTLEPGDVVLTGTPPGVGFARRPPVYLQPGDVVEVEIGGLGVLRNPVALEAGPRAQRGRRVRGVRATARSRRSVDHRGGSWRPAGAAPLAC